MCHHLYKYASEVTANFVAPLIYQAMKNIAFNSKEKVKLRSSAFDVLLMPLAETIKEFVNFILKGVDLIDHTDIFLLRTINHYVTLIMCTLS